jgi:hypothetical protein
MASEAVVWTFSPTPKALSTTSHATSATVTEVMTSNSGPSTRDGRKRRAMCTPSLVALRQRMPRHTQPRQLAVLCTGHSTIASLMNGAAVSRCQDSCADSGSWRT